MGLVWRIRHALGIVLAALASTVSIADPQSATVSEPNITEAAALMDDFAERTGLSSERPPRRYLWTDAFAVCNYLGLARATGEQRYAELALRLVDQVHHTLGRHREDDRRTGWISGLTDQEGERHPTRGGLRIGKSLPERGRDEPLDERLEWDRDGQYFHYLTKWMHALDQVTRSTGAPHFNAWARELAETAQRAFSYMPSSGRRPRMYWKMSIDLSYPLVPSMGQHDPLDGYITTLQLRATMGPSAYGAADPVLEEETRRFSAMIQDGRWATPDPLGIGGLLIDAYRIQQLMQQGAPVHEGLFAEILDASLAGLHRYARSSELQQPAQYRLAFRELGLAIGLRGVRRMWKAVSHSNTARNRQTRAVLEGLVRYVPLGEDIESFWRNSEHRDSATWSEHRDINEVMLATSLAPEGFLVISSGE